MRFFKPEITIDGVDYSEYFKGKPLKQAIEYLKTRVHAKWGNTIAIKSNLIEDTDIEVTSNTTNQFYTYNILQTLIEENIIDLDQDWSVKISYNNEDWLFNPGANYFITVFDISTVGGVIHV